MFVWAFDQTQNSQPTIFKNCPKTLQSVILQNLMPTTYTHASDIHSQTKLLTEIQKQCIGKKIQPTKTAYVTTVPTKKRIIN